MDYQPGSRLAALANATFAEVDRRSPWPSGGGPSAPLPAWSSLEGYGGDYQMKLQPKPPSNLESVANPFDRKLASLVWAIADCNGFVPESTVRLAKILREDMKAKFGISSVATSAAFTEDRDLEVDPLGHDSEDSGFQSSLDIADMPDRAAAAQQEMLPVESAASCPPPGLDFIASLIPTGPQVPVTDLLPSTREPASPDGSPVQALPGPPSLNNNNNNNTNIICPLEHGDDSEDPFESAAAAISALAAQAANGKCSQESRRKVAAAQKVLEQQATTVMVRNLTPATHTEDIIKLLESSGFKEAFDLCRVPRDFASGQGKGMAFVNFKSPEQACFFTWQFHGFNGYDIAPATHQGREANYDKWRRKHKNVKDKKMKPWTAASA